MRKQIFLGLILLAALSTNFVDAFQSARTGRLIGFNPLGLYETSLKSIESDQSQEDPSEIVARRIVVTGAVQGGYYRACVQNEASRFRRLVGTMTPPDDSDRAEIYVEGKRKMVEGFIRWCRKGDVGLSQVVKVEDVSDEEPTGLYDGFYVKVR